jgi:hypothetical protein
MNEIKYTSASASLASVIDEGQDFTSCWEMPQESSGSKNGDWETEADCMSSRNQGPCCNAGDTLG